MAKELLTNSRATSFKRCRRRHWFEYEQRLRPKEEGKALRMGTAVHAGLDVLKKGGSVEIAQEKASESYAYLPEGADELAWQIEETTVLCLISGWDWYWGEGRRGLTIVSSEEVFQLPLRNPETGAPTPNFDVAGKTDGIVQVGPGRKMVLEHKTCSESIEPDSDYWPRLQMDSQVSLYVAAGREKDPEVEGVLYDLIRKPTIKPGAVPLVDEQGVKVVRDANGDRVKTKDGKNWRQSASDVDGFVLQTRPMTPAEWGEKLTADIAARPTFYYARREIARLDADINEAMEEIWDIQKMIRDAQIRDRWYKTVTRDTCPYCPFFHLCSSKTDVTTVVPPGFVRVDNPHQELLA